jgi:hypothetical protein
VSLIDLRFQHEQTLDEARRRLQSTVDEVHRQVGATIRRVTWSSDRARVKLEGIGFWIEMAVDAHTLHAKGDIVLLGQLLGGQIRASLNRILERTFQKSLPP